MVLVDCETWVCIRAKHTILYNILYVSLALSCMYCDESRWASGSAQSVAVVSKTHSTATVKYRFSEWHELLAAITVLRCSPRCPPRHLPYNLPFFCAQCLISCQCQLVANTTIDLNWEYSTAIWLLLVLRSSFTRDVISDWACKV